MNTSNMCTNSRSRIEVSLYGFLSGFILVFLISAIPVLAQQQHWTPVNNGMWGGTLTAVVINSEGAPLAAVDNGVYVGSGFTDANPTDGTWSKVDDLAGVTMLCVRPDGTAFSSNGKTIHRSTDDGVTWEYVLNGKIGMVGFPTSGVAVWYEGIGTSLHRYDIASDTEEIIDFSQGSEMIITGPEGGVYVVTSRDNNIDGIYYSADGKTFERMNYDSFPGKRSVTNFLPINHDVAITFGPDGVKRTLNGGETWEQTTTVVLGGLVRSPDGVLYATSSVSNGTVFISTDTGATWQATPLATSTVVYAAGRDGLIIRGGSESVFVADQSHTRWIEASTGLAGTYVAELIGAEGGMMYAARYRERFSFSEFWVSLLTLYGSDDNGEHWKPLLDGIGELVGSDAAGNVYVRVDSLGPDEQPFGNYPYATILRSSDKGETWEHLLTPSGRYYYSQLAGTPTQVVDPVDFHTSGGIVTVSLLAQVVETDGCDRYFSIDSGRTFTCTRNLINDDNIELVDVEIIDHDHLFLCGLRYVGQAEDRELIGVKGWRYTISEERLEELDIPSELDGPYYTAYTVDDAGNLYGTQRPGTAVIRSTDGGRSWEEVPLPPEHVGYWWPTGQIASDSGNYYYSGVREHELGPNSNRFGWDRLLHLEEDGVTWREIEKPVTDIPNQPSPIGTNLPLIGPNGVLLDTVRPYARYLPEYQGGGIGQFQVFAYSTDQGVSWSVSDGDLEFVNIASMLITESRTVYVGTKESGVFRLNGPISTVPTSDDGVIRSSMTLSVRPMPAHDRAELSLTLESGGEVSVDLYDARGNKVTNLIHGRYASGNFVVPISLANLTAGAYHVRCATATGTSSIPIIVE